MASRAARSLLLRGRAGFAHRGLSTFRSTPVLLESFKMAVPNMGDSITEGVIVEWSKAVGDFVGEDEVLCVIETDKVRPSAPFSAPDCTGVDARCVRTYAHTTSTLTSLPLRTGERRHQGASGRDAR